MSDQAELEQRARTVLDELAAASKPEQLVELDRQFEAKLQRVAADAPAEMLDQLRVLWRMLKVPDDTVKWPAKALIMGAISYFVSPIDLIPDGLGKAGYLDDQLIVRLVYGRLGDEIAAFRAHHQQD